MSADNQILILETPISWNSIEKELRVLHCQAMENLTYNDPNGNPEFVVDYFKDCKVFNDYSEALKVAKEMEKDAEFVEYGIQIMKLPYPFQYYLDNYKKSKKDNQEYIDNARNKTRGDFIKLKNVNLENFYREALEKVDKICRARESEGVGYDIRIHNVVRNALNK